jgi:signal transduction histidine kinase
MKHRWWAARPDSTTALGVDVALGAFFAALVLGQRFVRDTLAPVPLTGLAALAIAAGLVLRRRAPLSGCLLGAAGVVADAATGAPAGFAPYANLVAVYSVGLYATRGRAWLGLLVEVAGVCAYFAVRPGPAPDLAGVLLLWMLAWTIGYTSARRRDQLAMARRLMRDQAVAEERVRIARELHDLIGHTVNVMLVQAGAARRVLARDPERTRELLTGLEHTAAPPSGSWTASSA